MKPPPWNLSPMLMGAWIGIPFTIAIVLGAVFVFFGSRRPAHEAALLALGALVVPIVLLFAQFPVYSSAKATYALGAAPAIGILAARGFSPLIARASGRAAIGALGMLLFGTVVVAYWVVRALSSGNP